MAKKRKFKKQSKKNQFLSPEKYIKTKGRQLKIAEAYITKGWEDAGITNVCVVREHPKGSKTIALLMVDLFCLGVKDASFIFNVDEVEYEEFIERIKMAKAIPCEYELAHNIVFGAIDFANQYGLSPVKEWNTVQYLFEKDDENIPYIEIEFGLEGKPNYVAGPYDDVTFQNKVLRHLEKTAGVGNFSYYLPEDDWNDDEDWDDDEDEFSDDEIDEMFDFSDETLASIIEGEKDPSDFQRFILLNILYLKKKKKKSLDPYDCSAFLVRIEDFEDDDEVFMQIKNNFNEFKELITLLKTTNNTAIRLNILNEKIEDSGRTFANLVGLYIEKRKAGVPDKETDEIALEIIQTYPQELIFRLSYAHILIEYDRLEEAWEILGEAYEIDLSFPFRSGKFMLGEIEDYLFILCKFFTKKGDLETAINFAYSVLDEDNLNIERKIDCIQDLNVAIIEELDILDSEGETQND